MFASTDFWVVVSFIAFFAIVFYLKVPGLINKALDDRAEKIRRELDEARRLREEAQAVLADYQRRAREAEEEAKAIIDQSRREAEALEAETELRLKDSLERRTRLAEEKIARAEAQAIDDVRSTAIDVAVAAAEAILKEKSGGDKGNALIEDGIRKVSAHLN
jgi:F-type H+-transporting ATPase subunit b